MAELADAAKHDPQPDITGRTLGDFQVLRKLGQGGMGQVYLARQLSLKREIALKLLRTEMAENKTALARFQAEAEAIARISHPNIVQVYAIGEQDGLRYMALEYVEGRNLRSYLERKGAPELPVALAILRQVAAALQRANELGIVHRDIKPENILLTKKVEVKVADFGLSRLTLDDKQATNLTQSGVTVGTPLYMSPEQVRGLPTDHRSDIYSFGVTAYHLLAGTPPFTGTNAIDVAMKHVSDQAEPLATIRPDLPADLCSLVHKMMAKKPEDRYASAKEVMRDLAKIREGMSLGLNTLGATASMTITPVTTVNGLQLSTSAMQLPIVEPPTNWSARILGTLVLASLFAGGWLVFGRSHPAQAVMGGPALSGLPDARLPESIKLESTRERELVAKLEKRTATLGEVIDASIELGLLYLKERRFAEAEKVFTKLGQEKPASSRPVDRDFPTHSIASQFGLGIVYAHQDKAKESVAVLRSAIEPHTKKLGQLGRYQQFFAEHRDFALALADAIQRDTDNLKTERLPVILDRLRSPTTMLKDG
jgi:eukaryotic-like serine/threonine-protein kinase